MKTNRQRYIRTAMRIIDRTELGRKTKVEDGKVYYRFSYSNSYIYLTNAVRTSNDVKKLIDVIVCVDKKGKRMPVLLPVDYPLEMLAEQDIYDVYGGIFTKKGIIYATKLDDKGNWKVLLSNDTTWYIR